MTIRVHQADVSMSMTDGEALTPMQMSRIVAATLAQWQRQQHDEHSRMQDTRLSGSSCSSCQQSHGSHGG